VKDLELVSLNWSLGLGWNLRGWLAEGDYWLVVFINGKTCDDSSVHEGDKNGVVCLRVVHIMHVNYLVVFEHLGDLVDFRFATAWL